MSGHTCPSIGAANRAQQFCNLTCAAFVHTWLGWRAVTAPPAHPCVLCWSLAALSFCLRKPLRVFGVGEGKGARETNTLGKPAGEPMADLVASGERKWLF